MRPVGSGSPHSLSSTCFPCSGRRNLRGGEWKSGQTAARLGHVTFSEPIANRQIPSPAGRKACCGALRTHGAGGRTRQADRVDMEYTGESGSAGRALSYYQDRNRRRSPNLELHVSSLPTGGLCRFAQTRALASSSRANISFNSSAIV